MQPNVCSTWLISIDNHRVLERASGAMFLNEKPPMSMIQGKCACFRAKMVQIPGHLPRFSWTTRIYSCQEYCGERPDLCNDSGATSGRGLMAQRKGWPARPSR